MNMGTINLGKSSYPNLDIAVIESKKNAKFVGEFAIKGKYGWTESPAQIYYQETPPVEGYSHYFALLYQGDTLMITSGESVVGIPIHGLKTASGEIIFSRFRHDFRSAESAQVSVDGGFDYFRVVGNPGAATPVVLTIKGGQIVEVTDPDEAATLESNKKKLFGSSE